MINRNHLIILLLFITSSLPAMVYENRYFPLIQKPYITTSCCDSYASIEGFATTAHSAFGELEEVGIPEIFGRFDEAKLAVALEAVGKPIDSFPPAFLATELPWKMDGKIQAQGVSFSWEQYFGYGFSAGFYGLAMRVNSTIDFMQKLGSETTAKLSGPGDLILLDDARRAMIHELGLTCDHVEQHGFGDLDVYARWSGCWNYILKLRTLRTGLRFGGLIPTGVKKNIFEPASVPFGGNGHWGIYGSIDAEFEIKEDWKVGILGRVSKRFEKTRCERMPRLHEQELFGVIVGPAKIDPGLTGIFSFYGQFEGLREGFGLRAQYTLVSHRKDHWCDERADKSIPVNLEPVIRHSAWASEYITLSAFYDFEKVKECRGYLPIITASWDIPVDWLVGHDFVKSYKIALGLEFNF
jgi:hypothetical protein